MKTKFILIALIIILSGCNRQEPLPENLPLQPSQTVERQAGELNLAITQTPRSATITPLPTHSQPTSDRLYDEPPEWVLQADEELGFAMKIPDNWQQFEPQSWGGESGSSVYQIRESHFAGPNAICQMEVNSNPNLGSQPTLQLWNNNQGFYGCEILPSADAIDPNAMLLAWYPNSHDTGDILEFKLTPRYLNPVKNGLQPWGTTPTNTASTGASSTPVVDFQITEYAGLQFEEYYVTSEEWYRKHDVEAFASRLPGEARQRQGEVQNNWKKQIPFINQQLASFGVQIEGCTASACNALTLEFGEKYGDQKSISVTRMGDLLINQSGTRFFLAVEELNTFKRYLISEDKIEISDFPSIYSSLGHVPSFAFLGDDLIQLKYDPDYQAGAGYSLGLQVLRNDELIFTYTVLPPNPASGPVRGLYVYGNHWYLEVADVLIRDGVVLNDEANASEMFAFHFLNGKPFYFYRQEKEILISYNETTLPITYQRVIHEPMCCSGGMVNMTLGYNALGFYALRDGNWYYVVITPENSE
ncbi:MAG: hypothetical protein K0B14_06065 [Anaerolineaceae bacterium]|nr:hypothetical protein [Anaerolineaceae bacterium]